MTELNTAASSLPLTLLAVGRAVLADPAWAAKVADGRLSDIRPYDKSADATLY